MTVRRRGTGAATPRPDPGIAKIDMLCHAQRGVPGLSMGHCQLYFLLMPN